MNKQQVLENIEIARKYLDSFHLLLPDDKVIFDCYCLPPFGEKSFYAQIYIVNNIYRANCAYTHYPDLCGIENYAVHFTSISKSYHAKLSNYVTCKCVFPEPDIINELIKDASEVAQTKNLTEESNIIDGRTAGIRLFENGCVTRDICLINPIDDIPLFDELLLFSDTI